MTDAFQPERLAGGCLEATVRHVFFPYQAEGLRDSACARSVAARHEDWRARIPEDDETLWAWLDALADEDRMALLAHCVTFGVNALHERTDHVGGVSAASVRRRLAQADRLAHATGLDMVAAGWRRGQLPRPRAEGARHRDRARGEGGADRGAARASQEGRARGRGGAPARGQQLAARALSGMHVDDSDPSESSSSPEDRATELPSFLTDPE